MFYVVSFKRGLRLQRCTPSFTALDGVAERTRAGGQAGLPIPAPQPCVCPGSASSRHPRVYKMRTFLMHF